MRNKYDHEQIKEYIIENQKVIFEKIDDSIEIVAAEKKCGKYTGKIKSRYGEKVKILNKWCDLVGISNNHVYFIEVKSDLVIPRNLNEYIEAKQSYYYKLKKIKYVFIAPKISNKTKKQIVLNDFIYIELGYNLSMNKRKYISLVKNVEIKDCRELHIIEWLNKYDISQEYLKALTFYKNDAILTFGFKNEYCINWYLKFTIDFRGKFYDFYRYSIYRDSTKNILPHSTILLDIIKPEHRIEYRSHIYYTWNNVENFMKIMPFFTRASSRDIKIIDEYFNYKFKIKNILRDNISGRKNIEDIINELI